MNNELIIEAIGDFKNGLTKLETALGSQASKEINVSPINTALLAERLAYSYTTIHPEYGVQSQYRNLTTMVNSDKVSFIFSWLRKYNVEGIENFFKLSEADRVFELNKALTAFEKEIKDILTKRFAS